MTKIFVLTREHNEYDQHGSYFVRAFSELPSLEKLAEVIQTEGDFHCQAMNTDFAIALSEHLRKGGGRRGTEDVWYNLDEVELD